MATKMLAARKYLSFDETVERLDCKPNDLRAAIASGELRPSIYINEPCAAHYWIQDESDSSSADDVMPAPLLNHAGHEVVDSLHGWYYLQCPWNTGAFSYSFELISKKVRPDKTAASKEIFYYLPRTITHAFVESNCVFMISEIDQFEREVAARNPLATWEEKPLLGKERNNLLTTIGILASLAKLDLGTASKTATVIAGKANELGINMSRTTIAEQLTRAREAMASKQR